MINALANLGEKVTGWLGERTDFGLGVESPGRKQLESLFEENSLSSLFPYEQFDEKSGLFYNENSVGFVLETIPLVGSTEEMQRELQGLFQTVLEEGSTLQVLLWADPHIDSILETWEEAKQEAPEVLQGLAAHRKEFWKGYSGKLPARNYRVIISYSEKCSGPVSPVEEKKIQNIRDQVQSALKVLAVNVKIWKADHLLQFIRGMLDAKTDSYKDQKWNKYESLKSQIKLKGKAVQVTHDGLLLDDTVIRCFGIENEPDLWSLYAMGELIGDQFRDLMQIKSPFMMHYGVTIPSQDMTKARVQTREDWVEAQARSKIGKKIPILVKQSKELSFLTEQLSQGERFVKTTFNVVLLSNAKKAYEEEQILKSLFRSKEWRLIAEKYIHAPIFISSLPLCLGDGYMKELQGLQRVKTTVSSESANLLPMQGEWKGTGSNGMLLQGRRGQMFTWNPFDNRSGNYNTCVVGRSGSGKSVFMQELLTTILGNGGRAFVLDVGRSFEKTVKLYGGSYVEFSVKSPVCINPFTHFPKGDGHEVVDNLSMLKPILSLMASPQEGTSDLENAQLEKALHEAWEAKQNKATISDVVKALESQDDSISQTLAKKLYPYTKKGIYGRFFEGDANVDLTSKLVVIELEELKEKKDLQAVIVQMMIMQITNQLYLGDRQTPAALILDEAWDMLRSKQSGAFIETAARRLRKYYGSLVIGTQTVNDLYANPGAQAAFDNSDYLCLLSQKKESIDQLKVSKRLSMDNYMESLLRSVKTQQGEYAEIMITGPHGYAIGRLILDNFSKVLYSTKPDEFAAVQKLIEKGEPMDRAVELVAKRIYGS